MVIKRWMIERHLNEWKGRIMGAINGTHGVYCRSLGCILYELSTGEPPFYCTSIVQLVQVIVKVGVVPACCHDHHPYGSILPLE